MVRLALCAAVCSLVMGYAAEPLYAAWTWTSLDCPNSTGTYAYGVEGNKIVGAFRDSLGRYYEGFVYDGTAWTTLTWPQYPLLNTFASDISDGNIVGWSEGYGPDCGFIWTGTSWTKLAYMGSIATRAFGMSGNNIVGCWGFAARGFHGLLYDGSTWTSLDYPGASSTQLKGISGNNIVGSYDSHGCLYNGTTWTTLDFPGASSTQANGIEGKNIVGSYDSHGFFYNGSNWTTLDFPGAISTQACGVSGNTVVGSYVDGSGSTHGFMLIIPEPASAILVSLGGLALFGRRR